MLAMQPVVVCTSVVSCAELDQFVAVCKSAGSLGSRLLELGGEVVPFLWWPKTKLKHFLQLLQISSMRMMSLECHTSHTASLRLNQGPELLFAISLETS